MDTDAHEFWYSFRYRFIIQVQITIITFFKPHHIKTQFIPSPWTLDFPNFLFPRNSVPLSIQYKIQASFPPSTTTLYWQMTWSRGPWLPALEFWLEAEAFLGKSSWRDLKTGEFHFKNLSKIKKILPVLHIEPVSTQFFNGKLIKTIRGLKKQLLSRWITPDEYGLYFFLLNSHEEIGVNCWLI